MSECNHVFIGRADGVYCTKCGQYMSPEQYIEYLNSKKEKPKRQARKKVNADG